MTIRRQILLLPIAVALLACLLMAAGLFFVDQQTRQVARGRELDIAEQGLRTAIDTMLADALDRATLIASLPQVQTAVAARDDAALEQMFAPAWALLRDETGIEQLQFHTAPATSLIRIHNLMKRGDDLSAFRKTVVDANTSGQSLKGLERGRAGLGARGVAVIRHDGQPVGSVEVGLSMAEPFLRDLAARTGNSYEYYAIPESAINVFGPKDTRAARVGASGAQGPLLTAEDLQALQTGGMLDRDVDLAGAHHFMRAIAVDDYTGSVAGVFTVATPTAIYDTINASETWISIGAAALSVLVAAVLAVVFGRGIVAQISALAQSTVALAQGDRSVRIIGAQRQDELGDMARALEVFAENLAQNERMQVALRDKEASAHRAEVARLHQEDAARAARDAAAQEAEALHRRIAREEMEAARTREEAATAQLAEQSCIVAVLAQGLEALSRRDLTQVLLDPLPGDYDKLRLDFNDAVAQLSSALSKIVQGATHIDAEAVGIARSSDELTQNTERNAATLEQTAAALNQLTAAVQSAAEGASLARDLAGEARVNAETGVDVVARAVSAMAALETSAQAISRITTVIDDIAFQTNLLALNAGVEAARAGDAGRGFAVVASEVRALAQRSSEAAKEISGLIDASDTQVHAGVALVGQTGEALTQILVSVRDISDRVVQIAVSSREQAGGISEINAALNQLGQTTQHTATMFERTSNSGRALTAESAALLDAVRAFTLLPDAASAGCSVAAE